MALDGAAWALTSNAHGWDQWIGQLPRERYHVSKSKMPLYFMFSFTGVDQYHVVFFNKAWLRISTYTSRPWRPKHWSLIHCIHRFFIYLKDPPPTRLIDIAPFPSHITTDGVAHFPQTGRPEFGRISSITIKPDVLIFATGCHPAF